MTLLEDEATSGKRFPGNRCWDQSLPPWGLHSTVDLRPHTDVLQPLKSFFFSDFLLLIYHDVNPVS